MARYKVIDTSPRFPSVDIKKQLAGTFEQALDWLVDRELDLTSFDARYCNDMNGAPSLFDCQDAVWEQQRLMGVVPICNGK
jgi:hypothetical protein